VTASYAGSSLLARQIERGAPADVFISADLDWMDYLASRGLIDARTRTDLLGNRLVLIVPAESRIAVEIVPGFPLAQLVGRQRLAIADPDHVPAGRYGRVALEKLGIWTSVENKLARGENVRAALNFVARGETPLGIVYRTDANAEKKVRVLAQFPAHTHPAIVYPAAVTAASKNPSAAAFISYLKAPAARAVFERHGFTVPNAQKR
jgi:molybdate transport system substrate-binding protein